MDIERMREYAAIVEEGGLTAASSRLHVTQPALSKHLAALEKELGVRLLERGNGGAVPTAAGRQFYQDAVDVVSAYDQALGNMARYAQTSPTRLTVAAFVGYKPTDDLLATSEVVLTQRGVGVTFDVHDFSSVSPFDELRAGKADICLMAHSSQVDLSGLVSVPLIWEPAVAIVPANNPLAERGSLSAADLNGHVVWEVGTKAFTYFNPYLRELLHDHGADPRYMRVSGTNSRQLYSASAYTDGGLWVNFASIAKYSTPVSSDYKVVPLSDDLLIVVSAVYRRDDALCAEVVKVFQDVLLQTPLEVYWTL